MIQPTVTHIEHQEAWELLPWYVNNTLDSHVRKQIDTHLEACRVCRNELEEQHSISQAVHQTNDLNLSSPDAPFEKLMVRIDANEQDTTHEQVKTPSATKTMLQRLYQSMQLAPPTLRWALGVQTAAIVLLVGSVVLVSPQRSEQVSHFETLTDDKQGMSTQNQFRVVFSQNSTEKTIREVLLSVHARIIDGPSRSGVYTIAIKPSADATFDPRAMAVQLRSHSSVQFAEPIFSNQQPVTNKTS